MPTLTIIISLIILAVYIFLLVANKSNPKTNGCDGCTGSFMDCDRSKQLG